MIVNEVGKYRLLENFVVFTGWAIGNIPKGTVIEITQVDKDCEQVIGEELGDWVYWSLPVERVE